MQKHFIIFIITLVSFSIEARVLTWKEAVELTQKNNPDLQAAIATYQSTVEAEKAALAGFLPKLNASVRGSESGAPSAPSEFSYAASLTYTHNLFAGFADYHGYKIKKLNTAQALNDLNTVKARISQELKQVYAETYYTQLSKKLTQSILKRREENLKSVQLQYDVGRENKGSLLLSKAYVESAKLDVLKADNEHEINIENLKRYLGLQDEEIIIDKNIEKENLSSAVPDYKSLAEKNYQVIKAQNDEQLAQSNLSISKAQFSPSLDFSASYAYADTEFFPKNDSWSLGLTLSLSLFDGFSDYATYSANQYKLKSSSSSLQNTLLTVIKNLKQKYLDYVEALQQELVDVSFNQATTLRADIARNKYKTGLLSFEDWDLIESDLIQKEKQNLLTEKNRIIKQSLWEQAQGIGVFNE